MLKTLRAYIANNIYFIIKKQTDQTVTKRQSLSGAPRDQSIFLLKLTNLPDNTNRKKTLHTSMPSPEFKPGTSDTTNRHLTGCAMEAGQRTFNKIMLNMYLKIRLHQEINKIIYVKNINIAWPS